MVSLSLTAVPIFVIQLVLGKPRLLLAIAFYLSLYGLKFQRFVTLTMILRRPILGEVPKAKRSVRLSIALHSPTFAIDDRRHHFRR
jgi:hypothetical protein